MTREEFLLDMVKYYSEDTNRRCTGPDRCYYSPISVGKVGISEGCAIGRHLTPELQLELDSFDISSVTKDYVFERLPNFLQELGKMFLFSVQSFHDQETNWTSQGKINQNVMRIVKEYDLDKKMFREYAN